jgi:beta-N-acetylhexosaminidase
VTVPRAPLAFAATLALVLAVGLAGCGEIQRRPSRPISSPTTPVAVTSTATGPTPTPTPSASTTTAPPDAAARALAAMTEAQRVGQLFMVGTPATNTDPTVAAQVQSGAVGSVFLSGNSTRPASQTASMVAALQQQAGAVRLFVSTDQEGGTVQRLQGPDFSAIPSALIQGRSTPAVERADAKTWGRQLVAAGVNLDLAPVMDTVPSAAFAPDNPPIGALDREFGYTPAAVTATGTAFLQGLLDAGVDSTAKHFPGLGRVTSNTDTSSGVTDSTTTSSDSYLAPFAAAITDGTPFVMMSSAIYRKIDPQHPAAFSPAVVTGLLRGQLHFPGVVISDDLGAARQVAGYAVGDRAVEFIAAGGDMVLTIVPSQIPAMTAAVLARVQADPTFAAQVDAAALAVLEAKQARGLLN